MAIVVNLLFLYLAVTAVSAVQPGFQIGLTNKGLEYAREVG